MLFATIMIHRTNVKWCVVMAVDKFHIKKQEYSNRTLRFPVELLEELNVIATSKNISLNQLVVKCCEYAMKNFDDKETGK